MFATNQEGIQAIQKQILADTPPEHALYIPAQGKRTTYVTEDAFDLHQAVSEFLKFQDPSPLEGEGGRRSDEGLQKDSKDQKQLIPTTNSRRKVLLLLGDTGSGKSLFCQDLVTRLWQNYKPGNPIPLFISLSRLQNPLDNAIEETLAAYGFSAEQIATLKKEQQFIFVLDGYDEIHLFKNLYVTNKLSEWQARTIITCRSQYLYYLSDTDKHFMPFHGEKRQPQLLQQFYVAPFSEKEIVAYVQQYEKLNGQAIVADLKDHKSDAKSAETPKPVLYQQLISIPGLQTLINTPFLLHLAVEALPDILVKYKSPHPNSLPSTGEGAFKEQQKLTQAALYDVFIERWFTRQELKLKTSKHIDEKAADPKPNFWKFCKELAVMMRAQNVTLINYVPASISKLAPTSNKSNPWKQFFREEKEIELLRSACPIRKLGQNQYGFIHASLIEYFATRAMYEEAIAQQSQPTAMNIAAVRDNKGDKQALVTTDAKTQSAQQTNLPPLPQSTLYQTSITKNNNMIQFLADRVHESEVFKKKSFEIIELSKTDERYAIGAANAITILNVARIVFSEMNFDNIKIKGANLNASILDGTQLRRADLRDVTLRRAWLRRADFSEAHMMNVDFGESLPLQVEKPISDCCYSSNGKLLGVSSGNQIYIYDAVTHTRLHVLKMNSTVPMGSNTVDMGIVNSIAFSPKGQYLISGGKDSTLRLWDVEKEQILQELKGHTKEITTVAFSPDGELVASGSKDSTIIVWNSKAGNKFCSFGAHTSWSGSTNKGRNSVDPRTLYLENHIIDITFSPDGKYIASTADRGRYVSYWELEGKVLRDVFRIFIDSDLSGVIYTGDGKYLVAGIEDKLWISDVGINKEDKRYRVFEMSGGLIKHLTSTVDGKYIAAANKNAITIWEIETGAIVNQFVENLIVTSIAFNFDGTHLAVGNSEGHIKLLSITKKSEQILFESNDPIYSLATNSINRLIASGGHSKNIVLWDLETGRQVRTLDKGPAALSTVSVAFSNSGKWMAANVAFGAHVWDVNTGKVVLKIGFDLKNRKLESMVSQGHELNSWEKRNYYGAMEKLHPHSLDTLTIVFSPNEQYVALAGEIAIISVWSLVTKKLICILTGHTDTIRCLAFHPLSKLIISGSHDHTIRLWSIEKKQQISIFEGHTGHVRSLAFSNTGQEIISASADRTVCLWNIAGFQLSNFCAHSAAVCSVAFGPGQRLIASGSVDNRIVIWHTESEKKLAVLEGFSSNIVNWIENESGLYLITSGGDKAVRCWKVNDTGLTFQIFLYWTNRQSTLIATAAKFYNAKGLEMSDYVLLKHLGAMELPKSEVSPVDKSESEKMFELQKTSKLLGSVKAATTRYNIFTTAAAADTSLAVDTKAAVLPNKKEKDQNELPLFKVLNDAMTSLIRQSSYFVQGRCGKLLQMIYQETARVINEDKTNPKPKSIEKVNAIALALNKIKYIGTKSAYQTMRDLCMDENSELYLALKRKRKFGPTLQSTAARIQKNINNQLDKESETIMVTFELFSHESTIVVGNTKDSKQSAQSLKHHSEATAAGTAASLAGNNPPAFFAAGANQTGASTVPVTKPPLPSPAPAYVKK